MKAPTRTSAAFALCICAAGCGGGGGGGSSTTQAPVNQAPVASFSATPEQGSFPLLVQFDASASSDADGTISGFDWTFDDGTDNGSGATIEHTFEAPGNYNVRLQVTDDDGASASVTHTISALAATVSGTIGILATSAADSDVNDRLRLSAFTPNNDFDTAQLLPNPVRLGGFLNLPGTPLKPDANDQTGLGILFAEGDPGDFYAIDLAGDEVIALTIAEPDADLDFNVYDANRARVGFAVGDGATESLPAPGAGRYFIEVFPADAVTNIAGASNYVLTVGQPLTNSTADRPHYATSSEDNFVPGEIIVRRSTTRANAMADPKATALEDTAKRLALNPRGRAGRNRLYTLDRQQSSAAGRLPAQSSIGDELDYKYRTLLAAKWLRRQPDVEAAEVNLRRYPVLQPDDAFYPAQWHYPSINLPAAWDITTGATLSPADQVIVAVLDTGIRADHPDLQGQLVAGYDFIRDPATARDNDGIDPDPTDEGDLGLGSSSTFHGTHVAGTVAARSNNQIGVAGVSWGAKIMPVRVLGVDGGTTFDIMQGVAWAAGLDNDSGTVPAKPADVINLSLGSNSRSSLEEAFLRDEVACIGVSLVHPCPRIIVVASAGNDASSDGFYPAGYEGVVAVSATTIDNARAPYSNFGPNVDVAAPGGNNATDLNGDGIGDGVISTIADDTEPVSLVFDYGVLSGTSMAAPHVAGVAALMKDVYPGLTPDEFNGALLAGALTDDLGAPGRDDIYGHGLINAQKAVLEADRLARGAGTPIPPTLAASVTAINFGAFGTTQDLSVRNVGSGNIDIVSIDETVQWLTVSPTAPITTTGNQPLTLTLTVDRNGLADGTYGTTVTISGVDGLGAPVNELAVQVSMQALLIAPDADAGLHYVVLVDGDNETVAMNIVTASQGSYQYTLTDVPSGNYRVFAGTDMDDDSFLCDSGEACGSFPSLFASEFIEVDPEVDDSVTGIDFTTDFGALIANPTDTNEPGSASMMIEPRRIDFRKRLGDEPGSP